MFNKILSNLIVLMPYITLYKKLKHIICQTYLCENFSVLLKTFLHFHRFILQFTKVLGH